MDVVTCYYDEYYRRYFYKVIEKELFYIGKETESRDQLNNVVGKLILDWEIEWTSTKEK